MLSVVAASSLSSSVAVSGSALMSTMCQGGLVAAVRASRNIRLVSSTGAPSRRSYHASSKPYIANASRRLALNSEESTLPISSARLRPVSVLKELDINRSQKRTFSEYVAGNDHQIIGNKLIPLINRLQEVFAITSTTLDLPQLVVVGSQSSGKSSVLENLVGKDFLPRGSGIVTRRPLILQLHNTSNLSHLDPSAKGKEWGEFAHTKEKFYDFDKIRQEIEAETRKNKGVSAEPIILKIFSPRVVSLTLVDTPGIARVAVGDQPSNIEEQIKTMVLQYIRAQNAIILAVSPANQDLATSDALKLAREVDPEGKRTIGVLTKLDLMDQGTHALDILTGKVLPLNLGYVGVVSRSQKDIQTGKPITDMLNDEAQFFKKHPVYKAISDRSGTKFLAEKCNQILTDHIEHTLPEIKATIVTELKKVKEELDLWGGEDSMAYAPKDKGWTLLQMLNKFSTDYRDALKGQLTSLTTAELNGGARIGYIFNECYGKKLSSMDVTDVMSVGQYRTALRNSAGSKSSFFIPEAAFETLIRTQLERLRDPSLQCAELTMNELLRIVNQLENKDMIRYHHLREKVVEVCTTVLKRCLGPALQMINNIIDCELAYINTAHPDFVNTHLKVLETPVKQEERHEHKQGGFFSSFFFGGKKNEQRTATAQSIKLEEPPADLRISEYDLSPSEAAQIEVIKKLLQNYFLVSSKQVQDLVVKAIWHFLVNKSQTELHKTLVAELYKPELIESLLQESTEVVNRREELQLKLNALKKAKKILQLTQLREFDDLMPKIY